METTAILLGSLITTREETPSRPTDVGTPLLPGSWESAPRIQGSSIWLREETVSGTVSVDVIRSKKGQNPG